MNHTVIKYNYKYNGSMWTGTIKSYRDYGKYIDFYISWRVPGINVYLGRLDYEYWLCVPTLDISSTLNNPDDMIWNVEKLLAVFGNIIDAITVSEGIRKLFKEGLSI